MPMFEVEFKGVFSILQLLSIIGLKCWAVKMVAHSAGFIGDLIAFSADTKSKVSVILAWQFLVPSARFLNDSFFEQQVHCGYSTCILSYAFVTVFQFVPYTSCPRILAIPGFYAPADSCYLSLIHISAPTRRTP